MMGTIRMVLALTASVIVLLILLPFHLFALLLTRFGYAQFAGVFPVLFHRCVLFFFGVRLKVEGTLARERPLLLVSNHVSWLDIVVLSAVAPLSFIAKSEMRTWPLFGTLARLQRTVFINRDNRRTAGIQAGDIALRMAAREVMVLFPEGTTSDANQLLPFKTPLFEAAKIALAASEMELALVQPIAINYTSLHGLHLGRAGRPHVAWPGEIGLGESLSAIVRTGALDVIVHVSTPIPLDQFSNRKEIAAQSAAAIRAMISRPG